MNLHYGHYQLDFKNIFNEEEEEAGDDTEKKFIFFNKDFDIIKHKTINKFIFPEK